MNTTTGASSAAQAKPYELPALKVDNLRHFSDHGLGVQFAEPRLAALVAHLKSFDGATKLKAGESYVTLTRLGNVTRTDAFFSVGSRHVRAIHYLDGNLAFSFRETDSPAAFDTLVAVIFGEAMPGIFRPVNGAGQDALRSHLKTYAWTLAGVSGLRAQALEHGLAIKRHAVTVAASNVRNTEHNLERLRALTPEMFAERRAEAKRASKHDLEYCDGKIASLESALVSPTTPDSLFLAGFTRASWGGQASAFFATPPTSSHPIQGPNYTATVGADGSVQLSSGIVCGFKVTQVLSWLRGEAQAPQTRYGVVSKVAVATPHGEARYLLKCGCHWVDASQCSPELAELLKPDFTVQTVPGRPRVEAPTETSTDAEKEAFRAESVARLTLALEADTAARQRRLVEMVQGLAAISDEEKGLPELFAKTEIAFEAAKAEEAKAEAELAAPLPHLEATLEKLQAACLASAAAFSSFNL